MEIVEITVVGPGSGSSPSARLQIAPTDLFVDLRTALLECTTFCTYTSYNFEFEGTVCSDYEQIGSERRQINMVEVPYTFATIREHVQRLQDLLRRPAKSHSIENWLNHLVETNKADDNEKAIPSVALSVDEACQPECALNDNPSAFSSVTIRTSESDPPVGPRRLQGDLVYLDIHMTERSSLHVTGTQTGFYVNKTRDGVFDPSCKLRTGYRSSTLAALLMKSSQAFRTEFAKVISEPSVMHPLMQAPSPVPSSGSSLFVAAEALGHERPLYDGIKAERNWNDEFLVWNDQPGENTAEGALARFRNQYKTYADFVNSAISGSVAVVQGEIAPLNINEPKSSHVYLHDNIFFSVAVDSRGVYKDHGGDLTAHKFASHDLHAAHIVSKLVLSEVGDARLHPLMSVVVDYAGVRLVCQAIIPGILNGGGSTLLFGSIDQTQEGAESAPMSHVNKIENQTLVDAIEKLSERLHWSKSDVLDAQGNVLESVALPMDSKVLSTSDGRTYLMDLVRITPRDVNFDTLSAVLRLELVQRWCHDVALEKVVQSQGNTKPGDRAEIGECDAAAAAGQQRQCSSKQHEPSSADGSAAVDVPKEGNDSVTVGTGVVSGNSPCIIAVADLEAEATLVKFNVNQMTQYRVVDGTDQDLKLLERLAQSIHEHAIPSIVNDMLSFSLSCIDSRSCSALFHSHGVNMRYLGHVHQFVIRKLFEQQPEQCVTLATILYKEMLVRSCKHMLSGELRSLGASAPVASVIVNFINDVLQRSQKSKAKNAFYNRLHNEMASRFSYVPDNRFDYSPDPMPVLTGICQALGLRIKRRLYDFSESGKGLLLDDLLDMKPVPKYHLPDSIDSSSVFAAARIKIAKDDHSAAHDIVSQLVQVLCSVTGSIHPDVAEAFSILSLISYRCGDTINAIDHSYRVIIIFERLYGSVDGELTRAHSQHALFLMCGGFHKLALKHAIKAKQMFELLGGSMYPEIATAMLNVGVILIESGKPIEALEVQLDALSRLERSLGADAKHLHIVTSCHAVAFSYAVLRQFREAIRYEQRARSVAQAIGNEGLVAQCNSWLGMFTKGAVLAAKKDPQQITVKPTAAALAWISASQLAKTTSYSCLKEITFLNNDCVQQLQQEVHGEDSVNDQDVGTIRTKSADDGVMKELPQAGAIPVEDSARLSEL